MRAVMLALLLLAPVPGSGQSLGTSDGRLECSAFAVSTGGVRSSPVAERLDIVVERASTEAERQRLLESLKNGQDAILDTLRDLPRIGYLRTAGTLAWDLHYAHVTPGEEGGRRLVIATDRPISNWEAVNRPRTIDYPFTFIELRLDEAREGEGELSVATRVLATKDGRFVQLENYDSRPVRLNQVSCR